MFPQAMRPSLSIIDSEALPLCEEGWEIELHRRHKTIDLTKSALDALLTSRQRRGFAVGGRELYAQLARRSVLNACVLDALLLPENHRFIPNAWQGQAVTFWGTLYVRADRRLFVRFLARAESGWKSCYRYLGHRWRPTNPAAILAPV